MSIFGMLCRLEVRDRNHCLRQSRMLVFVSFYAPLLKMANLGLNENLLTNNLIDLFGWRFRLGAGLVLIAIFNC